MDQRVVDALKSAMMEGNKELAMGIERAVLQLVKTYEASKETDRQREDDARRKRDEDKKSEPIKVEAAEKLKAKFSEKEFVAWVPRTIARVERERKGEAKKAKHYLDFIDPAIQFAVIPVERQDLFEELVKRLDVASTATLLVSAKRQDEETLVEFAMRYAVLCTIAGEDSVGEEKMLSLCVQLRQAATNDALRAELHEWQLKAKTEEEKRRRTFENLMLVLRKHAPAPAPAVATPTPTPALAVSTPTVAAATAMRKACYECGAFDHLVFACPSRRNRGGMGNNVGGGHQAFKRPWSNGGGAQEYQEGGHQGGGGGGGGGHRGGWRGGGFGGGYGGWRGGGSGGYGRGGGRGGGGGKYPRHGAAAAMASADEEALDEEFVSGGSADNEDVLQYPPERQAERSTLKEVLAALDDKVGDAQVFQVKGFVEGRQATMLFDSGAFCDIVYEGWLKKNVPRTRPVAMPQRTADGVGGRVIYDHAVTLHVDIGDRHPVEAMISPAPLPGGIDLIVGFRSMAAMNMSVKFGKGTYKVGKKRFNMPKGRDQRYAAVGLRSTKEVEVPARTHQKVRVHGAVAGLFNREPATVAIFVGDRAAGQASRIDTHRVELPRGLEIPRGIHNYNLKSEENWVWVSNYSKKKITIPQGGTIALAVRVNVDQTRETELVWEEFAEEGTAIPEDKGKQRVTEQRAAGVAAGVATPQKSSTAAESKVAAESSTAPAESGRAAKNGAAAKSGAAAEKSGATAAKSSAAAEKSGAAAAVECVSEENIRRTMESRTHLSKQQQAEGGDLLMKHRGLFPAKMHLAGAALLEPMDIKTVSGKPIYTPRRSKSKKEDEVEQEEVENMKKVKAVRPSRSACNAPILLVKKKDGSWRFCVDFRRLNADTMREAYPMPRIDAMLDKLRGAKYFSTCDALSGYWQIPLTEEAMAKTAFSTARGHYEFTVVPMGATNAPAHFQRAMDMLLSGLNWEICLVYLDDIMIFSETWEEHLRRVDQVLTRLAEAKLMLKWSKCKFFCNSTQFLGHVVDASGVRPDPAKVEAITNAQRPTSTTEIRRFVNMVGHYRRFIHRFADKAEPLNRLLHDNTKWEWGADQEAAYEALRTALTSAPVLAYPDFGQPFIVQVDASQVAVGATLLQKQDGAERVICYGSRQLLRHQQRYSTPERELLAISHWVTAWRRYLYGADFEVRSDHQPLGGIIGQGGTKKDMEPPSRVSRLALKLQAFEGLRFVYVPSEKNTVADALSRAPFAQVATAAPLVADGEEGAISSKEWARQQREDPMLGPIIEYLERRKLPKDGKEARRVCAMADYTYIDRKSGLLYHTEFIVKKKKAGGGVGGVNLGQLALPEGAQREKVLEQYHSATISGHRGAKKVLARIREKYWWPAMAQDVSDFVAECKICQERQEPHTLYGLLQPTQINGANQLLWIDFAEMPKSDEGYIGVLAMQDGFDKLAAFAPVKDLKASSLAKGLVEEWICRHGTPVTLGSDRGAAMVSEVMAKVCEHIHVKQAFSTAHHPQSHGQVENLIKQMKNILAKLVSKDTKDWPEYLRQVEATINFSVNSSTGVSPYTARTGREPRLPVDIEQPGEGVRRNPIHNLGLLHAAVKEEARRTAEEVEARAKEIKVQIEKAQAEQKKNYDKHRKQPGEELGVGKMVLCKQYQQVAGAAPKLLRGYEGPWEVTRVINDVNREIRHCSNKGIVKTVHVEKLKPFRERKGAARQHSQREIEEVLQEKTQEGRRLFRVHWKGFNKRKDTWEPLEKVQGTPAFQRFMQRPEGVRVAAPKPKGDAAPSKTTPETPAASGAPAGEEKTPETRAAAEKTSMPAAAKKKKADDSKAGKENKETSKKAAKETTTKEKNAAAPKTGDGAEDDSSYAATPDRPVTTTKTGRIVKARIRFGET